MATVLRAVVDKAIELNGEPPDQIVLTRPAVWGPYRREQFEEVPLLSGLTGVRMVTEPVAAATYYAATKVHRDNEVVAIYDLGGGTFDATVVRLNAGDAEILGVPEGIEWLGGLDFDEAVVSYVDQELGGAVSALSPANPREAGLLARLRQECTLAKEALSSEQDVTIRAVLPSGEVSVHLTRAAFEERIRPAITATVEALQRTLSSAEITPAELSAIVLVGGSSRIPLISAMLEDAFHRPVAVDTHPKHAVALGAAMIAQGSATPAPGSASRASANGTNAGPRRGFRRKPGRMLVGGTALAVLAAVAGTYALTRSDADPGVGRNTAASGPTTTPTPGVSLVPADPAGTAPSSSPSAGSSSDPTPSVFAGLDGVSLPPANGQFDEQIGGAYPPAASVTIVERDRRESPVPGKYNICYVNAFQTQADDAAFWTGKHGNLLLKDTKGKYFSDPDWPNEYLLDTSTVAKRAAIIGIVGDWVDGCASRGFQALAPDNLDSWTTSKGRLTATDNLELAALIVQRAHSRGLAVAQRNAAELGDTGKAKAKFDFAITDECQVYQECEAYLHSYGNHVIEIEHADDPRSAYTAACANQGKRISVILRDSGVVARNEDGYFYESC
jgi:actin-like ATPase involved in cell morphogenesis